MSEVGKEVQESVDNLNTDPVEKRIDEMAEPVSSFGADAATTSRIKAALVAGDAVSALSIDVDTDNGVVTLSGTVASEEQIQGAVDIAESVEGVREVHSTLQVKPE